LKRDTASSPFLKHLAWAALLLFPLQKATTAAAEERASIDFVPQVLISTTADARPIRGNPDVSDLRLDTEIKLRLARGLIADWTHHYSDNTIGRALFDGHSIVVGSLGDMVDTIYLDYAAARTLHLQAGYRRRSRVCCPGAGARFNPRPAWYSGPFIGALYGFGPRSAAGPLITYGTTVMFPKHEVSAADIAADPPGLPDSGNQPILSQYLYAARSLDPRGEIVVFFGAQEVSDYYNHQPIPLYYDLVSFGVVFTRMHPSMATSKCTSPGHLKMYQPELSDLPKMLFTRVLLPSAAARRGWIHAADSFCRAFR